MGSYPEFVIEEPDHKLLVTALDERARKTPHHTWLCYANADWETNGYHTITYGQGARAVDKLAFWIDEHLGQAPESIETIAYYGPSDARYGFIVPACIKAGRRLLMPDGRMSPEGLKGLVKSSDCKAWINAEDDPKLSLLGPDAGLPIHAIPSLDWLLDNEKQTRYPYDKTYEEAAWDDIIIIHTSGTTGEPRPIYHSNAMWSVLANYDRISRRHWPRGIVYESWYGKYALNCCPPQWIVGIATMLAFPIFTDSPCIMLPPLAPGVVGLTPEVFKKIVQMTPIEGVKCPPHTIMGIHGDAEAWEMLKSMEFVVYLGAALDRAVGDELAEFTKVSPQIGTTEGGDQISLRPVDRRLWYTHDFVPENGHRLVPLEANGSTEGLHEYVVEQLPGKKPNYYQMCFWNPEHRDLDRVELKEIYRPVRDLDGRTRWELVGRKDDLTKLNWLAKFHAEDIENRIARHGGVENVLVGGEGRPTPFVLVEVKEAVLKTKSEKEIIDELYEEVIVGINKADIEEVRIPKSMVLVAKKEKPFQLNLKQAVMRRAVEADYLKEIEQAYNAASKS